jgi:predicted enzyme related to lactoylglutathione lyase
MHRKEVSEMVNGICHVEIPVTDLKKAKEFYSKVFGWTVPFIDEKAGYALFDTGTPPNGGFSKVDKVTPSQLRIYVMVDDIERKLQEIKNAGGKAVEKTLEIPGFGWEAKFSDVFGNVLGLFKPLKK